MALTAGSPAPVFTFTDLDGRARTLSEYRGKVVLLDFWGVWCAPCVAAAPGLVAIYEKFHGRGFEIIGIDMGDTREKMTTFTEARKMRWPETMEADKGPIQTLYRITGFPTYFLLDAEGKIRFGRDRQRRRARAGTGGAAGRTLTCGEQCGRLRRSHGRA